MDSNTVAMIPMAVFASCSNYYKKRFEGYELDVVMACGWWFCIRLGLQARALQKT
jgi:hypothetical protein